MLLKMLKFPSKVYLQTKSGFSLTNRILREKRIIDQMKNELRREFHPAIEIMFDESLRKPLDIEIFAQMEVADVINFYPSKLSCSRITREVILRTQKLDMKASIGSVLITEIGLYHYLNLAASIPCLDYPLEEPGIYNLYGYSIVKKPLEVFEGKITLRNIGLLDLDFNLMKHFVTRKSFILKGSLTRLMRIIKFKGL